MRYFKVILDEIREYFSKKTIMYKFLQGRLQINSIKNVLVQPTYYRRASTETPTRTEKSINTVTILGRVGNDPQLRGSNEHPVVMFSVATHANYKYENGDWAQRTDWHRVVVFKPNLRETVMDYLKKGQRTMIQGKLTYGEITDHQGNQKPSCSIVADDVIFFRESSS